MAGMQEAPSEVAGSLDARSDARPLGRAANLIVSGGTVLTLDEDATVVSGDVWIEDGRIAAIGAVTAAPSGTPVLDARDCLVLPGLIQGHVHLGQTVFRGLGEGRRLLAWLRERIWPLEAAHDDESAYWCSLLGAAECLLGGTTTVQDIGIGPGIGGLLQAAVDSRLRVLTGQCLMDSGEGLPPRLTGRTDQVLADTVALGNRFDGAGGGRVRYLLNPRFILSCSEPLWQGVREIAAQRHWQVHTHALEQQEETAAVRASRQGRDEIEYFADLGMLATDLCLAHGVWLSAAHLPRLARARTSVVHCPSSNLKLGSGVADVVAMRRAGLAVGVGADGAPCNNRLDALEEVRLAALLQKLNHGPEAFSGLDALRLATSEGALAVGLEEHVGTVEVGKAADLLVLSTHQPELTAAAAVDPHDLIAFGAARTAVRHVMVEGELLVEDGRLAHLDLGEILRQARRTLGQLLVRSGLQL
jgi:5-methylthioadenosine/S-adenosylhomocysteine deaminase